MRSSISLSSHPCVHQRLGRTVRRLIEPPSLDPSPVLAASTTTGGHGWREPFCSEVSRLTAFFEPRCSQTRRTPSPSDPQSTAAAPQNGTSSRVTTYDAAYFTPFAPRTALDIARRVPGFQLDLGVRSPTSARSTSAASPGRPAMSSSTARARAPSRKPWTQSSPASRPSGWSASRSAPATSTARTIPARARC